MIYDQSELDFFFLDWEKSKIDTAKDLEMKKLKKEEDEAYQHFLKVRQDVSKKTEPALTKEDRFAALLDDKYRVACHLIAEECLEEHSYS